MRPPRTSIALACIAGGVFLLFGLFQFFFLESDDAATNSVPQFNYKAVGPEFSFRPTITNVQVVDFHGTGKRGDLLACDAQGNSVLLYERQLDGSWNETLLADNLLAPAHATLTDIDQDGDNDVIVSVMGNLHPDDGVIGSVVLLENSKGTFNRRTLLSDVRRVVDVQPSDFDGDGDIDLAVAVFGYLRGQVLWLEQMADGSFKDHEIHSAPGTIHVPVADYDNDGDDDIAAVVSQEDEEVWLFENTTPTNGGTGEFRKRKVFQTVNYDLGTAGLVRADLDNDGDVDLLLPVGDNLEDRFSHGQPYHGCLWLENKGKLQFEPQRLCNFPGTYAADVGDLDGDSDNDVVLVSMTNNWDAPDGHSIVWLENDGEQSFTKHGIAKKPIQLVTVACGDINNDGRIDIVAGGLHVFRPYDRLGRISSWTNVAGAPSTTSSELTATPTIETGLDEPGDEIPTPTNLSVLDDCTKAAIAKKTSELKIAASRDTDRSDDWLGLGDVYFAFGFFEAARSCYRKAAAKDGDSVNAKLHLGMALGRLGKLAEAKSVLASTAKTADLAGSPESKTCWHELGRCCLRMEQTEEASVAFAHAGDHPWSLYERAKLLIRSNRPSEALPILDELGTSHPAAIEYFILRANAYEAMGNLDEAARLRDMAEYNARLLPSDHFTTRIESVRETIGLEQKNGQAFALLRKKDWSAACALLGESAKLEWNQQVLLLLASSELKRGNADKAIHILTRLMTERGNFPEGMLLLGDAYEAAKDDERARRIWEQLAEVRPGIGLHQRLARMHERVGDDSRRRTHEARASQAQGIADLRHSKISLAAKSFERALAVDETLATSWFYLGECHRLLDKGDSAKNAYQKCLLLDPGHGRAARSLSRLDVQ